MSSDTAPERRPIYPKGITRRKEIMARAIEVFARRGSKRTSLRAIASEVGVAHSALKHYFGSLDELLVAVYRESVRSGEEHDLMHPDATPVEVMRAAAAQNREVPGLVQLYSMLVTNALEDHPAARQFVTERFAEQRRLLAARVVLAQREGRMRPDVDPVEVAALAIAASDGLQSQWLLDSSVPQEGALTLLERLLSAPSTPA